MKIMWLIKNPPSLSDVWNSYGSYGCNPIRNHTPLQDISPFDAVISTLNMALVVLLLFSFILSVLWRIAPYRHIMSIRHVQVITIVSIIDSFFSLSEDHHKPNKKRQILSLITLYLFTKIIPRLNTDVKYHTEKLLCWLKELNSITIHV
jgi:hypothetical protein